MEEDDKGFAFQASILSYKLSILALMDNVNISDLLKFVAKCYFDTQENLDKVLDFIKQAPEVNIIPGRDTSECKFRSKRLLLELARTLNKNRKANDRIPSVKI